MTATTTTHITDTIRPGDNGEQGAGLNALSRVHARLTVGAVLEVVENEVHPKASGDRYLLTKVLRKVAQVELIGDSTAKYGPRRYTTRPLTGWISLPTRVRNVEWLDDDTVRLPHPKGDGTSITYRLPAVTS